MCIHTQKTYSNSFLCQYVCILIYLLNVHFVPLVWVLVNIWWDGASEHSHIGFVWKYSFRINFSGGSEGRAFSQKWEGQNLNPELIIGGKMFKNVFYGTLLLPLSGPSIPWWFWSCTTNFHPSTPSQSPKILTKFASNTNISLIGINFVS